MVLVWLIDWLIVKDIPQWGEGDGGEDTDTSLQQRRENTMPRYFPIPL